MSSQISDRGSESTLTATTQAQPTVAVLPFHNLGSDTAIDYLSLAVPSEITTTLSRASGVAVRPFARSASYQGTAIDFGQAGAELRAKHLITGQYFATGDEIQVTLEAITVADDKLLWRESLSAPGNNLTELSRQVTALVQGQLLPLLGSRNPDSAGTQPSDSGAYQLYLQSLGLSTDPEPNQVGIDLLEEALEHDSGYAPIWVELSRRLHRRGNYAGGGAADYDASDVAAVRALSLDPELVEAGVRLTLLRTERGALLGAYDLASELVIRRPDSAKARFAMSYVLRYAGLIRESAVECDVGLSLDPTELNLRSCGHVFERLGDFARARMFYAVDAGSLWEKTALAFQHIAADNVAKTLAELRQLPKTYFFWRAQGRVLEAYLENPSEMESVTQQALELYSTVLDAETLYGGASTFAFCGQKEASLDLLRKAIEGNYCAVDLDAHPAFSKLLNDEEFQELHKAALDCQQRFLDHRSQTRK